MCPAIRYQSSSRAVFLFPPAEEIERRLCLTSVLNREKDPLIDGDARRSGVMHPRKVCDFRNLYLFFGVFEPLIFR